MRRFVFLVAAAAALSACQRENVEVASYLCGDLTVSAVFRDRDRAVLVLGNEKLNLLLVLAASGAKYADSDGNEFWTKGVDEAMLTLAGTPTVACKATGR